MTGVSAGEYLLVCVVGQGFDSTSHAKAAWSDDRLAQKTESAHHHWRMDCVDSAQIVQMSDKIINVQL